MAIRTFLVLVFSFVLTQQYAQSIPSYWMNIYHLYDYYAVRGDSVENIKVDVKEYYDSGESYTNKWTYAYKNRQTIQGTHTKDGDVDTRFEYKLDSLNQVIKRTIDSKFVNSTWRREGYEFDYQGGKLTTERQFSDKTFVRLAKYSYNNNGFLTKITFFNHENTLLSYETAIYMTDRPSYMNEVFNDKREPLSEHEFPCKIDSSSNKKNDYGDWMQILWLSSTAENTVLYTMEYQYDKRLNWTERKIFIVVNGKKKSRSVVKRKLVYK